jgi:hypothetical protein
LLFVLVGVGKDGKKKKMEHRHRKLRKQNISHVYLIHK